jgi:hypothetical protein
MAIIMIVHIAKIISRSAKPQKGVRTGHERANYADIRISSADQTGSPCRADPAQSGIERLHREHYPLRIHLHSGASFPERAEELFFFAIPRRRFPESHVEEFVKIDAFYDAVGIDVAKF